MKKVIHIDMSADRIMRVVEEQADYYAAKSGAVDTTYINGLLTESDKRHLMIYLKEALTSFDSIAEEYPHEFKDGEITLCMPMNFDETRAESLRDTLWQFIGNHILTAWMTYNGTKPETFVQSDYLAEAKDLQTRLRALLNHRKRLSPSHFEDMEPKSGLHVEVY